VSVTVLAGGVGGARFVRSLVDVVDPTTVVIIGNVADDIDVLGLHVSPDLDTLLYKLGRVGDDERGWGRARETWNALETVKELGGEAWFQLGDRDIGLHLVRTEALRNGEPLSSITSRLAEALHVGPRLLPATDDRLRTLVRTPAGELPFQDWFVRRGHRDPVDAVAYEGADTARPAPGVIDALEAADLVVIAPSNPFVSIGPILAIDGIRAHLEQRNQPAIAVSPLIGGRAVKGPGEEMFQRLVGGTTPAHVAGCYEGLIDALVFDQADADGADEVRDLGIRPLVTTTLMDEADARRRLVETVLGALEAAR
jgi:LPPG:FO 2-phospho-L-lactate transferase